MRNVLFLVDEQATPTVAALASAIGKRFGLTCDAVTLYLDNTYLIDESSPIAILRDNDQVFVFDAHGGGAPLKPLSNAAKRRKRKRKFVADPSNDVLENKSSLFWGKKKSGEPSDAKAELRALSELQPDALVYFDRMLIVGGRPELVRQCGRVVRCDAEQVELLLDGSCLNDFDQDDMFKQANYKPSAQSELSERERERLFVSLPRASTLFFGCAAQANRQT